MSGEWKEAADEVHLKRCRYCGKKVEKPVLHRGNVFCSDGCKDSFVRIGKPTS